MKMISEADLDLVLTECLKADLLSVIGEYQELDRTSITHVKYLREEYFYHEWKLTGDNYYLLHKQYQSWHPTDHLIVKTYTIEQITQKLKHILRTRKLTK